VSQDGLTRSAILLLSIGEEEAAEVFRHLGPREVHKLGQAMAKLDGVSREQAAGVLRAFRQQALQQAAIGGASDQFLRNVLTRALGAEKAGMLLQRILRTPDHAGIENLKWMDAASVVQLIGGEHPQIIAAILAHLDAEQAAEVLKELPEALRNDVVLRIATLDAVQPAALQDLNDVLGQLASGGDRAKKAAARGGVEAAAEVMNRLGGAVEAAVSAHLREIDPDLAQRIQDKMFVFDNLVDLDDRAIQMLLREVQSDSLVVALKGTNDALKDKLFKNMSQRAAEMLRDDLDAKGPVRLSEVEAEQREILRIVRRLAEEGQIVLSGAGAEGLVQ
jgi:flagellar motor switch protein FliG